MNTEVKQLPHESAISHVTGEAKYVSDIQLHNNLLWGQVYFSPKPHAIIKNYDLSEAMQTEGVIDIVDFKRIPGVNQLNALSHDELCLAEDKVTFIGQAIFLIAAKDRETAIAASKKIKITFEEIDAILTIEDAMASGNKLSPTRHIETGNPEAAMESAKFRLNGTLSTGAQEHWYLETQAAICVPGENRNMSVFASSQNPTETQNVVAEVLGLTSNQVICEVKRMGGGFGGKETQANPIAAWAALLADITNQPVMMQLSRDEDQKITGKRHPFLSNYEIGFDENGIITAYIVDLHGNAGSSFDLSIPILERAMFHADNSYFIENMRVTGTMWKTNQPSNTAFRGFGGPQGMAVIENAIDRVARFLGKDAAELRFKNFYEINSRNLTHYGQLVKNNKLQRMWNELIKSSEYYKRRKDIELFNQTNKFIKKGLALTPLKFGISFTTAFLNQAGALVLVYKDGSVMVNHGGTEMGQGLHTKILHIAAKEFGITTDRITISPTNTSKVPNTSPTAASSGTDLNGMAVKDAIKTIKNRLKPLIHKILSPNDIGRIYGHYIFKDNFVYSKSDPKIKISFAELVRQAHIAQISLSATGYYGTPDIFFDREKGKGKPFHYYAFGMAVSEVEVDILTGNTRIMQTDILHDAGKSIHPEIDKGQIMGGFIQGVGWCTSEVVRYDKSGNLLNCSPDTYKIPGIGDFPNKYKADLLKNAYNPNAIHQSKAIGEPPFMHAFSVWMAIKDAISSVANHTKEPDFSLPATKEVVIKSITNLK
jgi:xanthine dehydrogenase molybdopterin binding subunit